MSVWSEWWSRGWAAVMVCGALWGLLAGGDACAAERVGLQRAIEVMKALEGRYRVYEYRFEVISGELQDVDDPTSLVKKDATWLRGYVVYDRTNGR
ncbi:MAG: hypothetical protein D6725_05125, partial [Planctomycetota bacterium]